tara:strand:- start:248 stop:475 length:228 start_codon:yes stop_codon:yes gene_type:complete
MSHIRVFGSFWEIIKLAIPHKVVTEIRLVAPMRSKQITLDVSTRAEGFFAIFTEIVELFLNLVKLFVNLRVPADI